jgi:hypothetical protein
MAAAVGHPNEDQTPTPKLVAAAEKALTSRHVKSVVIGGVVPDYLEAHLESAAGALRHIDLEGKGSPDAPSRARTLAALDFLARRLDAALVDRRQPST